MDSIDHATRSSCIGNGGIGGDFKSRKGSKVIQNQLLLLLLGIINVVVDGNQPATIGKVQSSIDPANVIIADVGAGSCHSPSNSVVDRIGEAPMTAVARNFK
eukprot:scaffold227_cov165-Amphora_coffeaeformis.AAC.3